MMNTYNYNYVLFLSGERVAVKGVDDAVTSDRNPYLGGFSQGGYVGKYNI